MRTSITDTIQYRDFCKKAATSHKVFSKFRQNPEYSIIVENVTREQGAAYLYYIKKHMSDFGIYKDKFQMSDQLGSPKMEDYGEDGIWSPTTLRYVKVLVELEEYFGNMEGFTVCEIGGGYGGQCKIFSDKYKFNEYEIFDLDVVHELTYKFCSYFNCKPIMFVSGDNTINGDFQYDLLISNYAFSELSRKEQTTYLRTIDRCKRGYITYNNISQAHGVDSMSIDEFKGYIQFRKGFCVEEFPKTHEDNLIGIWGK